MADLLVAVILVLAVVLVFDLPLYCATQLLRDVHAENLSKRERNATPERGA